jgi:hypothetical protein
MTHQCTTGNGASAPNSLRFTRAALIDQESAQADTSRQKRPDSAGRLERNVGPHVVYWLNGYVDGFVCFAKPFTRIKRGTSAWFGDAAW